LSLRTGNAGALEIAVDGRTVPSIGGVGAMRRDVALDPTELAAGTAVHG
jgi:cytoskeleton protein RodZ